MGVVQNSRLPEGVQGLRSGGLKGDAHHIAPLLRITPSQAYHKETGIAGYTLVYHSRGFQLVQHEPFTSTEDAILRGSDIKSTTQIVEMSVHRMLVADTDIGRELKRQVEELEKLLYAYRHGFIKEKR